MKSTDDSEVKEGFWGYYFQWKTCSRADFGGPKKFSCCKGSWGTGERVPDSKCR